MIEKELQNLGLSPKETKVYLSALELGAKSAQDLARHANVNRVTCYVMLDNLIKRGLVSQVEGEKGRIFVAESPEKLLHYLDSRERRVKEQKSGVEKILPQLLAIFNVESDKPKVRYLEGYNGVRTLQKMVLDSKTKNIDGIVSLDYAFEHFEPRVFDDYRVELIKRGVTGRNIVTTEKYTLDYIPKGMEKLQQIRILPYDKFQFPGEIAIYDSFASIMSFHGKPVCIMIEHSAVVSILKSWFSLAWEGAEKFKLNKDDKKYGT